MNTKQQAQAISFAPMLIIKDGTAAIEFYTRALGAKLVQRWNNDDGSVHVAELTLGGARFHLREVSTTKGHLDPQSLKGVTGLIEVWVDDPAGFVTRAANAGAHVLQPVQAHEETNYEEGSFEDPFGHRWLVLRPMR